jgi:hypothetical protein
MNKRPKRNVCPLRCQCLHWRRCLIIHTAILLASLVICEGPIRYLDCEATTRAGIRQSNHVGYWEEESPEEWDQLAVAEMNNEQNWKSALSSFQISLSCSETHIGLWSGARGGAVPPLDSLFQLPTIHGDLDVSRKARVLHYIQLINLQYATIRSSFN